jgi:hypothetical protein
MTESAKKIFFVNASTVQLAIAAVPNLGEPWSDSFCSVKCVETRAERLPRSFWQWITRQTPRWLVTATFTATDDLAK